MITEEDLKQIARDSQFGVGNGVILNVANNPFVSNSHVTNYYAMTANNIIGNKESVKEFYKNIIKELESLLNQQLYLENKIENGGFLPEGITNLDEYLSALGGQKEKNNLIGKIDNSKKQKTQLEKKLREGEKIRKEASEVFRQKRIEIKNAASEYTKQMTRLIETIRKINAQKDITEEVKEKMLSDVRIKLYSLEERKQMVDTFQQKFIEHGGSTKTVGNLFYDKDAKEGLIDLKEIDKVQDFLEIYQNYFKKFGKSHYSHITTGNKELVDTAYEVLIAQREALAAIKKKHGKYGEKAAKAFFRQLQSGESLDLSEKGIILNWDTSLYRELSASQLGFGNESILDIGEELVDQIEIFNHPSVIVSSNQIQNTLNDMNILEGETRIIHGSIPASIRNVQQGVYNKIINKEEEIEKTEKILSDYQREITRQKSIIEYLENKIYQGNNESDIRKLQEEKKKLEDLLQNKEKELIKSREGYKKFLIKTETKSKYDKVDNAHYLSNGKETIIFAFSDKSKEGIYYSGIEYNSGSMLSNMDLLNTINQKEEILQAMLNLSDASVYNNPSDRKKLNEFVDNTLTSHFMQFMFNNINYQQFLKTLVDQGTIPSFQQENVFYIFRASGKNAPASRILLPIIKSLKAKMNNKKAYEDILKVELNYSHLSAGELWGEVKENYQKNKSASWAYVANAVAATTNINMEIDMAQLDALYSF